MNEVLNKIKNQKEFFIIFLFTLISYIPILSTHQQVSPDAYFILPLFDEVSGLIAYFEYLISLKTIDVQPLRDLSLLVDWIIFNNIGVNTFIFQNIFWWSLGCFFLLKITRDLINGLDHKTYLLSIIAYAVYPLFCTSISWFIARKHILSFCFILMATYFLILFIQNEHKKNIWISLGLYFFAQLSQPIGMLWCLWALGLIYIKNRLLFKKNIKILSLVWIVFLMVFFVNYIYYEYSPFFKFTFNSKIQNAFNFKAQIIAFFYYVYQLFFPYYPVTNPFLTTFIKPILGFLFFLIITMIYFWRKNEAQHYLIGIGFFIFPLLTILNTPELLFDTYLLISSSVLFVLIFKLISDIRFKIPTWILWILIAFWGGYSASESIAWTNMNLYNKRNFDRSPSCTSARVYANSFYASATLPPRDAIIFLENNKCLEVAGSEYNFVENIIFKALFVRYEDLIDQNKEEKLIELGSHNFFPFLVLAEFYLQKKMNENADEAIASAISMLRGEKLIEMYDNEILQNIVGYCHFSNNFECISVLGKLLRKKTYPYL